MNKNNQQLDANETSPLFQLLMISLSTIILTIVMYRAIFEFNSLEKTPVISPLTPGYLKEFGGTPAIVNVGLFIKDFSEFDMTKNEFVFSGTVWFEYEPSVTSLETLSKFSFDRGEILSISPPTTQLDHGKIFARYDVRVKFKTKLNFSLFPIADHTVYIILNNNFVTPGEVIYEALPSDFILSPNLSVSDWIASDRSVYAGYSVSKLEETSDEKDVFHPRVVFGIDYKRAGARQLLTILLPLLLIFYIAIFSFAIDPKSVIALSTGCVTALIAYRFVIENLSPRVGYFMLSDLLFFLFLGIAVLIFFVNAITRYLTARIKAYLTIIIHMFVIAISIYLIDFWLR